MNKFVTIVFVVLSIFGLSSPAAAADFIVTSPTMSAYVINAQSNRGLSLTRGRTYTFDVDADGHPFWIKTIQETGTSSTFDTGVTNNGISVGTLTFTVPMNAPSPLYYQCQYHDQMTGLLTIVSPPVPAGTDLALGVLGAGLALAGLAALSNVRRFRQRRPSPAH
jgi:hypothetical protein